MKECNSVKQSPIAGLAAYGGGAGSVIFGRKGVDGYQIDRSLRFNSGDSAYLNRTPSSAGSRTAWTWSGWVKRSKFGVTNQSFFGSENASNREAYLAFLSNDKLKFGDTGTGSSSYILNLHTTQVFRDPSAWYHIVAVWDSGNATQADRARLYVNGVRVTSFSTNTNSVSLNADSYINGANQHFISRYVNYSNSAVHNDGYLADVHFIDGQALAATDFGAFDADTGVWNPKRFSGSFGTNGFHLKFDDYSTVAALGTDSSGNTNTFTTNNFSVSSVDAIYAVFSGSSNQYLRKSGSGVLPGSSGSFTIECHFYPHTTNVIGLFDGGAGQTNIIRNYSNNVIENQGGGSVNFAGDYTQNAWNHLAVTYDGYTDTMTVYLNGTSSGTATFSSFTAGSNFDIGTINGGGDGRFDGFIRNFRVTHSVVYSSAFTAPSHTANLTAITNTNLLALTTSSEGLTGDASTNNYTLSNNGTVTSVALSGPSGVDSMIDTPTNYEADSGNNGGNYCTWNPLAKSNDHTLSNGNLDSSFSNATPTSTTVGTIGMTSGKFYWESTLTAQTGSNSGVAGLSAVSSGMDRPGFDSNTWFYNSSNGNLYHNNSNSSYGSSYAVGDVIGTAFDADNGNLYFYKNGVVQNSGTAAATGLTSGPYFPAIGDISVSNTFTASTNFGQRPFAYTPPTGYVSLCTQNLSNPTIADGSDYFDTKLWTGNGSTQSITGLEFSPDFVWIKSRNFATDHALFDVVRGATKRIRANQTNAENTDANTLTAFNSDGFSLGSSSAVNNNTKTFVGWAWDAGSSNTTVAVDANGSGLPGAECVYRANTTTGFSVVRVANPTSTQTRVHGLNKKPDLIICKSTGSSDSWHTYHSSLGYTKYINLNSTAGQFSSDQFGSQEPTSTYFYVKSNTASGANKSGGMIYYIWTAVEGYSAFGTYTGNGSADGPFVYTGFRPAFVIRKRTDTSGGGWYLIDTARDTYNVADTFLDAADTDADASGTGLDILSNGFKLRNGDAGTNANGGTYIYMAWAENPFKTARAR